MKYQTLFCMKSVKSTCNLSSADLPNKVKNNFESKNVIFCLELLDYQTRYYAPTYQGQQSRWAALCFCGRAASTLKQDLSLSLAQVG